MPSPVTKRRDHLAPLERSGGAPSRSRLSGAASAALRKGVRGVITLGRLDGTV